jgi:titin
LEKKDIVFSTLFGGSEYLEYLRCIDVNDNGDIVAGGETYSSDLPVTVGSELTGIKGKPGGFLFGLNSNGSKLSLCAYLGNIWGIVCDKNSDIHVTGFLPSQTETNISSRVLDPIAEGEVESFYMKFNEDLSKLHYATYLGGNDFDGGYNILVDESNYEVIVAGVTTSNDFPMKSGSFDTTYNGDNDIFLIKFNLTRTPSSPENLTARSGESFVELSWDPPRSDGGSPVDVYAVFKKPRGIDPFEMIGETRSLFFNDTDVENGREYYYYVRAHNWIGYGPPSGEINVIPLSIPSPPRNLTAEMIGDETIKLKWNEPLSDGGLNLKEYNIYKFEGVESIPEKIPIVPGKNDYTDRDVINGVRYGYYLTAWNDMGESLPSNMVNATPMTTPVSVKNITAESGNNFVLLKWEYPTDDGGSLIIDYRIHRSDGENTDEFTIEAGPTEYNDTDVINGNRYWYQVSSRNKMGNSPLSRSVTGDPIGPPTSPTELIADSSSATVKLSWKAPYHDGGSDLLGYNVYRNSDGIEWIKIIDMENKLTTYTDKFLDNGKTYRYRVTAYNDIGKSLPSNTVAVEPRGAPGKPLDLELIPGDKFIEITWKAPSSDGGSQILNYIIFSGERENDLSILKTISSDTFVFNDTGLINGREYFYSILAVNEIGEGPLTDTLSAIPGGKPSPPANILMTPGDGSVEISWEGPEDNGGFKISRVSIYRGTDRDNLEKIFGTDQRSGSYKDEGLENGKKFYYSLTCINSIGESQFSEILEITPKGKPSAPLSISARSISSDSIEISWSPPENDGGSPIIGYKVYRYLAEGEDPVVMEIDGNDTVYTDKGLSAGTTYIYRVSAVNSIGESDQSGPAIESTSGKGTSGISFPVLLLIVFILILFTGGIGFYYFVRNRKSEKNQSEGNEEIN